MRGNKNNKRNYLKGSHLKSAFTLIELVVVFAIIGILVTITVVSYNGWKQSTVAAQLKSDLSNVASAMENVRTFDNSYPTTVPNTFNPSKGVTLTGGSEDGKTFCVSATNSQFPTLHFYIDSTMSGQAAQSGVCPLTQKTLTLIADSGGSVLGDGTYDKDSTQTITATPDSYNDFSGWTGDDGCVVNEGTDYTTTASHPITMDTDKTCTAHFTPILIACTPPAPNTSQNTVGSTTTWSWTPASCSGNSTRYQYRYTISPAGYDSGWVETSSPPVAFTTSTEGQTYTVSVQTQFYNPATSTSWSASGSDSYSRGITSPSAPITTVSPSVTATVTAVSCASGLTAQYGIASRTNDGTWSAFSAWSTTRTSSQAAADGVKYGYKAQARCYLDASHISAISTGIEGTYTDPIGVCGPPSVTANTVSSTTTWSWSAVSGASGTSTRYQYRYTISPSGYDSGWVATGSNSVAMTTSTQGQTYTVAVQSQCYNDNTSSAWSGSGSVSYYRPITYTLTLGGSYGTYGGAGTYTEGSTATMTDTPTSTYYFNSWSGSTGCSGSQNHTILMNANKSCTATNTHWIPGYPGSQLDGKYVYYKDDDTQRRFKVNLNADNDTWSQIGVDPLNVNHRDLRDPMVETGLTWGTWYPAQYNCSLIGGRLPLVSEAASIASYLSYYGNNFDLVEGYRTAAENKDNTQQTYNRKMATNSLAVSDKDSSNPTRCVKGSY